MEIFEESFWKPVIERAEGTVHDVWYAYMDKDRALRLAHRYLEDSMSDQSRKQKLESLVNRLDVFYRVSDDDPDSNLKYYWLAPPEWKPYFAPLHELFGNYHLTFINWWHGEYSVIMARNILRICGMGDSEIDSFNVAFDKSIDDVFKIPRMKGVPRTIGRLARGYRSHIRQSK